VNQVKHPEQVPFGVNDPKTTLLDQLQRLPVPLAAQRFGVLAGSPVLKAAEPRPITPPVLE
jgi:hypothetical protein